MKINYIIGDATYSESNGVSENDYSEIEIDLN